MPVLSTRIVLDCFYLLIFYSEKFSTDVCRSPYAVNVNLNLSNECSTLLFFPFSPLSFANRIRALFAVNVEKLACVAGVRKGRRRELGSEAASHEPEIPFPCTLRN